MFRYLFKIKLLNRELVSILYKKISQWIALVSGQLMFSFAEFERNLIRERTDARRIAVRNRGRFSGGPEKLGEKE